MRYVGRFAPSPTGPLHAGSLATALASWLDARAHAGLWLVRIEDVDSTRCRTGVDRTILQQLAACGLISDQPPIYQSSRSTFYQQALDSLITQQLAYPCGCTRKDIALALAHNGQHKQRHGELIYPGTCRAGLHGKPVRAWRFAVESYMKNKALALIDKVIAAIESISFDIRFEAPSTLVWKDRRLGLQRQDVCAAVGDFVLQRADACFAYQLAVVVDDAAQGITDIVRGEDLADNTVRQILLQAALGLPTPSYLHTPLVRGPDGDKLSKQNGAMAIDTQTPLATLNQAAVVLGLPASKGLLPDALLGWTAQWTSKFAFLPAAHTKIV